MLSSRLLPSWTSVKEEEKTVLHNHRSLLLFESHLRRERLCRRGDDLGWSPGDLFRQRSEEDVVGNEGSAVGHTKEVREGQRGGSYEGGGELLNAALVAQGEAVRAQAWVVPPGLGFEGARRPDVQALFVIVGLEQISLFFGIHTRLKALLSRLTLYDSGTSSFVGWSYFFLSWSRFLSASCCSA